MALPAIAAAAIKVAVAKKKFDIAKKIAIFVTGGTFVFVAALSVAISAAIQRGDAARAAQVSLGAIAPPGLRSAALAAEAKSGIPANVLLAIAFVETTYGRAAASSDAQAASRAGSIPADVVASINQPALAVGGPVGSMLGFPTRTVRLGDWVNPTPVGSEHAMGFMQFLPSTWRGHIGEATTALSHAPDPYNPADALMAAGLKLKGDIPAGQSVSAGLSRALDAYGGAGYAARILAIAQQTLVAAGKPDACAKPVLTQGYGPVSLALEPALRGAAHYHTGADLSCGLGTQIVSVTAGVAHVYPNQTGWGNVAVIETGGLHIRYCHLSLITATDGQRVDAGSVIGLEGSSGASTGSHLHFEIDEGPAAPGDFQHSVPPFVLLDPAGYTVQAGAEGQTH